MPLVPPLDASADDVKEALAPLRHDFSVALHSFGNAFAAGAVVRVAHSFLAREIFVIGTEPYYAKASMGMEKYETVIRTCSDDAFFEAVRGRPVWAVEKDHARRSLHDVRQFPHGIVFVFGSERDGLSPEFARRADEVVGIPMYGVNHSFPVAVAAGIVMHEWTRRKYAERCSTASPPDRFTVRSV
jgi:tRNA G18 (ribose-2'-O)-methylase SpoU